MSSSKHLQICSGVLDCSEVKKDVTLTVNTREMNVFKITYEDITYLDSIMAPAYCSLNNEKVTDVSVRNSKYSKTFDLNVDLQAVMKGMGITNMVLRPYKLNLYSKGSFFAKHVDTNRSGLSGTFIIILPTAYTGGEICFGDFNLESTMPKDQLRFVYFDIGLLHSVTEVEDGNRITLVYNVFYADSAKNLVKPKVCLNSTPPELYNKLLEEAIEFCAEKKNILFGGECKYRNDVFYKLLQDLKKKFKVIDVVVEKNDRRSNSSRPNDITQVQKVYKINEDDRDDYYDEMSEWCELDEMAEETFEVAHVLFPQGSSMKERTIGGLRASEERYTGNSPAMSDCEVECYGAYLINPSPDEGEGSYDEENVSTDVEEKSEATDEESPEKKKPRVQL